MSTETELKLYIDPKEVDKFTQHPLLQSAKHKAKALYSNTYFDSPAHDLLQQGVGLRVRRIGEKRLQTLKTAGNALGGLHQRQEWENEITGDTPDYTQFPKTALPAWCAKAKNLEKLGPIFTTDFIRTTWDLVLDDSKIEVALDQGEIKSQTASLPLSEVELELKSGSPVQLYQMALNLMDAHPLIIENKTKAQRGYGLPLTYHKAGAVKLKPEMSAEQAFIHIIWHCIGHLQANEDMVLYGKDIEGVHQMRVALRRLRSCLSIYKPLIPNKTHSNLRQELKWITSILGVARDWDVFALSLKQMQAPNTLKDLRDTVTKLQTQAYVTVRQALRSPRYSRMLLMLGKYLTQRDWRKKLEATKLSALDNPARDFASQILESHYQRICKQGENFSQLNAEQLHELRISIKKMAYGTRFFAELYSPHTYAKKLSHLQDELGILNDGNVANDLLNQAGLDKQAPARYFLNGWYAHQQMTHLGRLGEAWQTFLKENIFWRNSNV